MDNEELFKQAREVIPGGVNSPVRAFGSVGGTPYFVQRAEGAYVWDVEGRKYIDYVQSWGASILGHAHPTVVEAVQRAAADGTRSQMASASSTSRSVGAPYDVPSAAARCTASTTLGWAWPRIDAPHDWT